MDEEFAKLTQDVIKEQEEEQKKTLEKDIVLMTASTTLGYLINTLLEKKVLSPEDMKKIMEDSGVQTRKILEQMGYKFKDAS